MTPKQRAPYSVMMGSPATPGASPASTQRFSQDLPDIAFAFVSGSGYKVCHTLWLWASQSHVTSNSPPQADIGVVCGGVLLRTHASVLQPHVSATARHYRHALQACSSALASKAQHLFSPHICFHHTMNYGCTAPDTKQVFCDQKCRTHVTHWTACGSLI